MCAIAGIVGSGAELRSGDLYSMLNLQRHRGPDDEGTYVEAGIALGHRRLSILDLSPAGRNPMSSADGRYQIVFNGEIFNYREIRGAVGSRYAFRTQTDTEVILAAYGLWGEKCLDLFEGMYAIAIWDSRERQLLLARDPFGIKPLYFGTDAGGLSFASEIKPLLTGKKAEPNYQTIYRYLRWGQYDHARETFFKGVFRLLPGERASWKNGGLSFRGGPGLFLQKDAGDVAWPLEGRLHHAVEIALRADVPIGVNLSGGLDSSLLAGLVNRMSGDMITLEGFLQDYDDPLYSERAWASEVASATGRHLNASVLTAEKFRRNADALLWHEEEPYGGVPVAGYLGLYRQAHDRNIVVLLDGNGLDECFAGYRSHHRAFLHELHTTNDPDFSYFLTRYCREWDVPEAIAVHEVQDRKQSGLSRDGTAETYSAWIDPVFLSNHEEPLFESPRPFPSALKNMMFQDLFFTKVPRALRFNDRVSMAFSKELRVPFLNLDLVRFGFALPDKALFGQGRPKGALRAAASGLIPEVVRNAPKRSVQTPQTAWLQGELMDWVRDTLLSSSFLSRGIFDPECVRHRLNDLGSSKISNSFSLWQALNLEEWFKQFIDTAVPQTAPRFDL